MQSVVKDDVSFEASGNARPDGDCVLSEKENHPQYREPYNRTTSRIVGVVQSKEA